MVCTEKFPNIKGLPQTFKSMESSKESNYIDAN